MRKKRGRPRLTPAEREQHHKRAGDLLEEIQREALILKGGNPTVLHQIVEQIVKGLPPRPLKHPTKRYGGWRDEALRVVAARHGFSVASLQKYIERWSRWTVVRGRGSGVILRHKGP
jgi:hypothetical protein